MKKKKKQYILVKRADGKMMYYHDGKYFDPAEIQKKAAAVKKEDAQKPEIDIFEMEELKEDEGLKKKRQKQDAIIQQHSGQILKELKVSFSGKDAEAKFLKYLETFLREIRKDKEFLYILTAAKTTGGLGLPEEQAQKILQVSKRHLQTFSDKVRKQHGLQVETIHELSLRKPVSLQEKEVLPFEKPKSPPKPVSIKQTPKKQSSQSSSGSGRRKIEDVQYKPALVGPLEELGRLDLVAFRRLGKTNEARLAELKEMFDLLQEESVEKKMQAKQNWTRSPLYKKYLETGFHALKQGVSVKEVLAQQGESALTTDECLTMVKLNEWLNY